MPKMDTYRHLNDHDDDGVRLGIEEIARQVVGLNYGTHRMLSAIVRARRAAQAERRVQSLDDRDELADAIEELLNRGLF